MKPSNSLRTNGSLPPRPPSGQERTRSRTASPRPPSAPRLKSANTAQIARSRKLSDSSVLQETRLTFSARGRVQKPKISLDLGRKTESPPVNDKWSEYAKQVLGDSEYKLPDTVDTPRRNSSSSDTESSSDSLSSDSDTNSKRRKKKYRSKTASSESNSDSNEKKRKPTRRKKRGKKKSKRKSESDSSQNSNVETDLEDTEEKVSNKKKVSFHDEKEIIPTSPARPRALSNEDRMLKSALKHSSDGAIDSYSVVEQLRDKQAPGSPQSPRAEATVEEHSDSDNQSSNESEDEKETDIDYPKDYVPPDDEEDEKNGHKLEDNENRKDSQEVIHVTDVADKAKALNGDMTYHYMREEHGDDIDVQIDQSVLEEIMPFGCPAVDMQQQINHAKRKGSAVVINRNDLKAMSPRPPPPREEANITDSLDVESKLNETIDDILDDSLQSSGRNWRRARNKLKLVTSSRDSPRENQGSIKRATEQSKSADPDIDELILDLNI